MTLPRLQYVTHPDERFDDLSWVHRLHEAGVKWIQLRIKEDDFYQRHPGQHHLAFFHETADSLRVITGALGMLLTINDEVDVAVFSCADGLHVGQDDPFPELEYQALQPHSIFGGTANSFKEMSHFHGIEMSYFGVGPFRETSTKAKLKPVLGLAGYESILEQMNAAGKNIPVFAIGGIEQNDIPGLLGVGVYGVAVSGLFFHSGHDVEAMKQIVNKIEEYELETGR